MTSPAATRPGATATGRPARSASSWTGTAALTRLIVRRDRIGLGAWILVATSFPLAAAAALPALVPTAPAREAFAAEAAGNPLTTAILGPLYGDSLEALAAYRSGMQSVFAVALGGLVLVIRHSRAGEQAGHRELLGTAPVGRHAVLGAAVGVAGVANLVIAVLTVLGLTIAAGYPVAGSVVLAASAAGVGLVAAAAAAVAAQLAETAAGARGLGFAVLGLAFGLRVIGDSARTAGDSGGWLSWLSWFSPIGWTRFTRAYSGDRWPVLLLLALAALTLTAVALRLSARRDLGSGLLPTRPGRAHAAPGLATPWGLSWRLGRRGLAGVAVAVTAAATAIGLAASTFQSLVGQSPILATWLEPLRAATIGEAFVSIALYLLGLGVAGYAAAAALRPRGEETDRHAELLLATPTSRTRWLTGHLLLATAGPVGLLAAAGLGAAAGFALTSGRTDLVISQLTTALVQLPIVWVVAGIATALVGCVPRLAVAVTWGLFGLAVLDIGLWELRVFTRPVYNPLSYTHPAIDPTTTATGVLVLIAAALLVAGVAATQRRDLG